jgi:hypothetical protein
MAYGADGTLRNSMSVPETGTASNPAFMTRMGLTTSKLSMTRTGSKVRIVVQMISGSISLLSPGSNHYTTVTFDYDLDRGPTSCTATAGGAARKANLIQVTRSGFTVQRIEVGTPGAMTAVFSGS